MHKNTKKSQSLDSFSPFKPPCWTQAQVADSQRAQAQAAMRSVINPPTGTRTISGKRKPHRNNLSILEDRNCLANSSLLDNSLQAERETFPICFVYCWRQRVGPSPRTRSRQRPREVVVTADTRPYGGRCRERRRCRRGPRRG